MTDKEEEREKLTKIIGEENFEECCKDMGFEVFCDADENKSKKKANI